ncbi:macro domain-containing protein [Tunicatimonas pelagia]|uniref:macro domain-containing protein n=1 Tax=Tunicatimonas pelagia TaxID=931531 RepID=UPI0026651788|nr:macro domain-containing protein [Tunicatimonas pelagia]WKN41900.1 macro domain-containing protein [Tunicatimonas pelagia]
MIRYTNGDIIQADVEALVNTVNTVGVMGKGLALSFKKAFPQNFKIYKKLCEDNKFDIGDLLITNTGCLSPKYIVNFPKKNIGGDDLRSSSLKLE